HIVVDPAGPVCLCGKRGCVERLASGPYMAQNVREILENEPQRRGGLRDGEVLRGLVGDNLMLLTGQLVSEAAAAGDDLAKEVLHKAAWAL
ncbi:MAG: ROK family protein, partial [Nostoc sp.]